MAEHTEKKATRAYLETLSKDELVDLLEMSAKNLVAMDGIWFQVIEEQDGMDRAMQIDEEVWNRFPYSEGGRIKRYYQLAEFPGLEGLEKAFRVNYCALANDTTLHWEGDALVYRTEVCRVQDARSRKGMEWHPCKSVGINEFRAFAKSIDPRIEVECLSCYPEITDETCSCSWKFTIPEVD